METIVEPTIEAAEQIIQNAAETNPEVAQKILEALTNIQIYMANNEEMMKYLLGIAFVGVFYLVYKGLSKFLGMFF